MLQKYAEFALSEFRDLRYTQKFHELKSSDELFNSDAGNALLFDCTTGHFQSGFFDSDIYSPEKIDEWIINPQPKTSPPDKNDYLWTLQPNSLQILKDAIGSSFLYDGLNMKGVRLSDNYKQKLKVYNALRYGDGDSPAFKTIVNQVFYRRIINYENGVLISDTTEVIPIGDGINPASVRSYSGRDENGLISFQVQEWITFDIDFNYTYTGCADLFEYQWFYPREINSVGGVSTTTYDSDIINLIQGTSYEVKLPIPTPSAGAFGTADDRLDLDYRSAISLKDLTFEDLSNVFQVPY